MFLAFMKRMMGESVQRSYIAACWRERAHEARAIASVMTTPSARQIQAVNELRLSYAQKRWSPRRTGAKFP